MATRSLTCLVAFLVVATVATSSSSSENASLASQQTNQSTGLQCPPCEKIHCVPRRPDRLKCRGGVTLGVCHCCPVCARVHGESCGGQWSYLGRCDRGLFCDIQENQVWHHKTQDGQHQVYHNKKGVCKPLTSEMFNSDQGHAMFCQPKCKPEFCLKNPKAICSAIDNAERQRDCQTPCQHTSCSACHFVTAEPDCVKCAADDFQCMRHFAKCIRKQYCPRQKFPCKKGVQMPHNGSKFMCMVPECLESSVANGSKRSPTSFSSLPGNRI